MNKIGKIGRVEGAQTEQIKCNYRELDILRLIDFENIEESYTNINFKVYANISFTTFLVIWSLKTAHS